MVFCWNFEDLLCKIPYYLQMVTIWLLICISLITFICLAIPAHAASTIVKRSGESGPPYLIPVLNGIALSFVPFKVMLACYVKIYFYTVPLSRDFYHENMIDYVKGLFCMCWDNHVIFFISLLIWFITFIILYMLSYICNHICITVIHLQVYCWKFLCMLIENINL